MRYEVIAADGWPVAHYHDDINDYCEECNSVSYKLVGYEEHKRRADDIWQTVMLPKGEFEELMEIKQSKEEVARLRNRCDEIRQKIEDNMEKNRKRTRSSTSTDDVLPYLDSPGTSTEIAVVPDVPYTPFVNYKRPETDPDMVVEVPVETKTGIIMPPLPKHVCQTPQAVKTEKINGWNSFESPNYQQFVVIPDGTTFSCVCGQDWFVVVNKVPYYKSDMHNQHSYTWKKMRWYHFGRRADLKRREEQ